MFRFPLLAPFCKTTENTEKFKFRKKKPLSAAGNVAPFGCWSAGPPMPADRSGHRDPDLCGFGSCLLPELVSDRNANIACTEDQQRAAADALCGLTHKTISQPPA